MSGPLPLLSMLGRMVLNPAPEPSAEYAGLEYRYGNLVIRPGNLRNEAAILAFVVGLLAWYVIGSRWNTSRVRNWWSLFDARFASQFRALSPLPDQKLITDGPTTYVYYLTGRRSCLSLHVLFDLLPRHSFVEWAYRVIYALIIDPSASAPEDTVTLDFTLGDGGVTVVEGAAKMVGAPRGQQGEGPGVWVVAEKSGSVLRDLRNDRWDTTFAKAQEQASVPQTHIVMSESVDSTEYVLKNAQVGLQQVLSDPKCARWLKSLVISDQPPKRPARGPLPEQFRARRLTMVIRIPGSKSQMEETMSLVQVAFNLVDMMAKVAVKPETTRKLRKVRTEVNEELTKAYAQQLKEEAAENGEKTPEELKREAKRKAEQQRRALLSPEEQRKLEEKDRKKDMRKAQKGKRM